MAIRPLDTPDSNGRFLIELQNGVPSIREVGSGEVALPTEIKEAIDYIYEANNYIHQKELLGVEAQRRQLKDSVDLRYDGAILGKPRAAWSIHKENQDIIDPARKAVSANHAERQKQLSQTVLGVVTGFLDEKANHETEMQRIDHQIEQAGKRGPFLMEAAKAQAAIQKVTDDQAIETRRQYTEIDLMSQVSAQDHDYRVAKSNNETTIKLAELRSVEEVQRELRQRDDDTINRGIQVVKNMDNIRRTFELAKANMPAERLKLAMEMMNSLDEGLGYMIDPTNLTYAQQLQYSEHLVEKRNRLYGLIGPFISDEDDGNK